MSSEFLPSQPETGLAAEYQELLKASAAWARKQAQRDRTGYMDPDDLSGACALAAAYLHLTLQVRGRPSKIAVAYSAEQGHAFVLCDGLLLDPTASQFGWASPLLMPAPEGEAPWYWKPAHFFKTVKGLLRHQTMERWPTAQRVHKIAVA